MSGLGLASNSLLLALEGLCPEYARCKCEATSRTIGAPTRPKDHGRASGVAWAAAFDRRARVGCV
jgi:hypothetical protein